MKIDSMQEIQINSKFSIKFKNFISIQERFNFMKIDSIQEILCTYYCHNHKKNIIIDFVDFF